MNSPLLFLSGAFFPLENLPGWARTLAAADPLAYGVDQLRRCIALRVPGHVPTAGVEWARRQRPLLLEGALLRAGGAAALIWAAHPSAAPNASRSRAGHPRASTPAPAGPGTSSHRRGRDVRRPRRGAADPLAPRRRLARRSAHRLSGRAGRPCGSRPRTPPRRVRKDLPDVDAVLVDGP